MRSKIKPACVAITPDSPVNPIRKQGAWLVVNPYFGCEFSCPYCRAQIPWRMRYPDVQWNSSVEVREHAEAFLKKNPSRLIGQKIILSTLGDPYQSFEKKYELTRSILTVCKEYNAKVRIITKSSLVLRDIDLLKTMDAEVGIELCTTNERMKDIVEPDAPAIDERTETLFELKDAGIKTFVHIYPYLPEITSPNMIDLFAEEADFILINTINFKNNFLKKRFFDVLKKNEPELLIRYQTHYLKNGTYFNQLKKKISQKADKENLKIEVLW